MPRDSNGHLVPGRISPARAVPASIERPEYVGYWPNVRRTLAAGGTLAIDNAISHAAELSDVNRLLADDPRLTTVLVPIGDGLLVSVEGDG